MRTTSIALLASSALATNWEAPPADYSFAQFQLDFGKSTPYALLGADELSTKQQVFETNLATIRAHNADGAQTWKMGLNEFADLTPKEFAGARLAAKGGLYEPARRAGALSADEQATFEEHHAGDVAVTALPAAIDWRAKSNIVTPVKNQGGCGSCWAFSTAETLESHIAIATGTLKVFSPQEYVDCAPNPDQCGGTGGCQGSTQWLGFKYAIGAGIAEESSYPYKAKTMTCDHDKLVPVANITGYVRLPQNNYTAIMNAIANVGPIAVSGAAEPWQLYSSGVFTGCSGRSGSDVDHAIQAVGYGTDAAKGGDYWIIRNSWGAGWGEKGYIRIARHGASAAGEPCVTDNTPLDGTGCKDGPKSIQVCGLCGIISDSSYPTGGSLL